MPGSSVNAASAARRIPFFKKLVFIDFLLVFLRWRRSLISPSPLHAQVSEIRDHGMWQQPIMIGLSMRLCTIFLTTAFLSSAATDSTGDWPVYGHDPGGQRFSPLSAINRKNVGTLKVAWTYRTGDAYQPKNGRPTAFEATPLYINGTLYLSTPLGRVIALDPVTGKQRWSYDPKVDRDKGYGDFANRGVSAWTSPRGQLRILVATVDARLIAVDAATGKPAKDFGDNGVVNLRHG